MATVYEYFVKDGNNNLTVDEKWPFGRRDGTVLGSIIAKLILDFEARAKYVSFYFPSVEEGVCPESLALDEVFKILEWPKGLIIQMGGDEDLVDARELVYTRRVYFYSEKELSPGLQQVLISKADQAGHSVIFRSQQYAERRSRSERPLAFICHDSRDKLDLAEPIAVALLKLMCTVWYDEYSLHVGDSLRQGIEKGIRECQKCIIILTPNFLKNGGWSKREYDSIFTRELVEKKGIILPVWHNVSVKDVFEYSPVLADKLGVQWSLGAEEVARRLLRSLNRNA